MPTVSWRMLHFPDGTKLRVTGMVEILAELYAEGRPANEATAEAIIDRLEAQKNYIPSSDRARKDYSYVLLQEYRCYLKDQKEKL